MEKLYIQAVVELLATGSDIETVLHNLRSVMTCRGHAKALPIVLRAVVRLLEQQSDETTPLVTVARVSDKTTLATEIKTVLATLGAISTEYTTVVDDTIIGGLIATYNHRQIDRSYHTKLVNLYQSIVSN